METSPENFPPGWGYGKSRERAEAPVARTRSVPPTTRYKKTSRPRTGRHAALHMQFALWASRLDATPTHAQICDHFGVAYETARRLLFDWRKIIDQSTERAP